MNERNALIRLYLRMSGLSLSAKYIYQCLGWVVSHVRGDMRNGRCRKGNRWRPRGLWCDLNLGIYLCPPKLMNRCLQVAYRIQWQGWTQPLNRLADSTKRWEGRSHSQRETMRNIPSCSFALRSRLTRLPTGSIQGAQPPSGTHRTTAVLVWV